MKMKRAFLLLIGVLLLTGTLSTTAQSDPTLSFTMQPPSSTYTTMSFDIIVQHSEGAEGISVTLALYDNTTGMVVDPEFDTKLTDVGGEAFFSLQRVLSGGEYYLVASAVGLSDVQSIVFTIIQPVMVVDTQPPPLAYTDETFLVEFSCRDPQTNEIVPAVGYSATLYRASNNEGVWTSGGVWFGGSHPAQRSYTIANLDPDSYYLQMGFSGCGEINSDIFEIRERPVSLSTSAACVGPDLVVNIADGNGPFDISASSGINVPVTGVSSGQTVIAGPDKWDDVTITETGGDLEATNLGTFKCRPQQTPVPQSPAHRSTVNTSTPTFTWTGIPDANNYRLFLFDDPVLANRTVDIRENTGSAATSLTPTQSLSPGRYFWRVRGRVNSVWSLWSVRYTLFVE